VTEGWVFRSFSDGGQDLIGWLVERELVLNGGLG
jgi:hypothetical protein